MKINTLLLSCFFLFAVISGLVATNPAGGANLADPYSIDVMATDTIPLKDRTGDFITNPNSNPFDLNDPPVIDKQVEYDPTTGNYIIMEKIGDDYFRTPTYMTFDEYLRYTEEQQRQQYFQELAGVSSGSKGYSGLADPLEKIDVDRDIVNRLFGGTKVDIRPQGTIDLTFGVDYQRIQDPNRTIRQQRTGGFDFDMAIQMSATGQIGEKLKLGFNYNTQATFDFDNQMKLEYSSDNFSDDEIVKSIEAGHVSLPLRGSLIQGAQSLFGIKTELQFGRLRLTALASQQKSQRENLQIQGGSQLQEFELGADQYDENRHFFVSHYNRSVFENALSTMPQINSLFRINQIQVWVTNDRNEVNNVRDIVALADLGEATRITNDNPQFQLPAMAKHKDLSGKALPGRRVSSDVDANRLHDALRNDPRARQLDASVSVLEGQYNFNQTKDYEKVSARLLSPNEFVVNNELGFISLNVNLQPDQVLGLAYTYEYNGEIYKVGEFADDAYNSDTLGVIFVKMLKSTTQRVDLPAWDLMMKNVYSIGAFQVAQEDFRLDIFYEDPGEGEKRFIPEPDLANKPMLQIFNLDRLNTLGDPYPDGQFDFVPGITINPNNGRVMFPVLEPFGSALEEAIGNESLARQYTYPILYDSTVIRAREYPEFNRFTIRGSYKSSVSSEISLGAFNLPPGSVTIRAGGQVLVEGNDYEVDYNIGRVKILNDAILNSGLPINVSFEDNTLFGFQTKTLLGIRADFEASKNLTIGGTYMHLFERPFTQKVNIGDDPISNRIYGMDVNYSKDAPWLTKAVDKIPFIDTKQPSSINFMAEAALLRPGHAKAINQGDDGGVVFVDDFEGSTSGVTLTLPANAWTLASVPQNDAQNNNPDFPESRLVNDVRSGMNRAHMSWFRLDQSVGTASNENPYTTQIPQVEVFPNRTIQPGTASTIQGLVLSYYPRERGPYNFDLPDGGTEFSAGLTNNGGLNRPETRWGGIMRALNTNDFQAANIEYLEFWMLNPFMDDGDGNRANDGGELCINLGNISEDILRDSRKFFENGITTNGTTQMDVTNWSRVPRVQAITNAFDNDASKRPLQDIGYDGQDDAGERTFFDGFMTAITGSSLTQVAKDTIRMDPSSDNFKNPRDDSEFPPNTTTLERYKYANGPEGNSPIAQGNQSVLGNRNPDTEDLNQDNTLSETESYFQYCIPIEKTVNNEMALSQFVTDTIHGGFQNNPLAEQRVWYRFKVPLDQYTGRVGGIQDFRSIRFIRMYLKGFEDQMNIRFATLDLIRNQWRRYQRPVQVFKDISNGGVTIGQGDGESNTLFDVNAVSIEENGGKIPFNYVLPLGITQERSTNTTFPDQLQNEQSLALEVCNLEPDAGRAIYKIINLDMRVYDDMKMYVHAEATNPEFNPDQIPDGDLSLFIRLGSDFEQNYYEYELPLTMSRDATIANVNSDAYKEEVWREENDVNINFDFIKTVKQARNDAGVPLSETFEMSSPDDSTFIRVKGNPNLGLVKGIMVGIINRSEEAHCAEVWINELRVTGIDERGGAAGLARLDLQMADFANVTASVSGSTIGWGGLEENVVDRAREKMYQYDIAASAELSKFLPEKWGLSLPVYAQYSNAVSIPEFDPYDRDITLDDKLDNADTKADRDSIRNQAIDQTVIKSFNMSNIRKNRTNKDKKPMPWNIENFSLTYAYTETNRSNPIMEKDDVKTYNGIVTYDYTRPATYVTPFKKLIKKDKYFKLITEANFNPLPNTFGFSSNMNRSFRETTYRFVGDEPFFNTFYNKQFTWDRDYNVVWDITKALKFNFTALNRAIIDEKTEFIRLEDDPDGDVMEKRSQSSINDGILESIRNLGRTETYTHNFTLSYNVPLKRIKPLDWITVKANYSADYGWDAPYPFVPTELQDPDRDVTTGPTDLGYIIQNGHTKQINGDFSFEKLYKKSKYLDKINKKSKRSRRGTRTAASSKDRGGKGGKGSDKRGSKEDLEIDKNDPSGKGKDGGNSKGKGGKDKKSKDKKKRKDGEPSKIERALVRPLLMVRKANLKYQEQRGTLVPGFTPESKYLGMNEDFGAPGWDFVAGFQPFISDAGSEEDWLRRAANDGWITNDVFQNRLVEQSYNQTMEGRLTLEPVQDFRIEIDARRSFTENTALYFKDTIPEAFGSTEIEFAPDEIVHAAARDVGSFSTSYFALNTLFRDDIIELFSEFENNREIISQRLGDELGILDDHEEYDDYRNGLGRTQQDVLLPAFIATYTGEDVNSIDISENYARNILFKTLPRLNWKVNYTGLSKIEALKEIFSSVGITHGYKSTLTVNSYQTNQEFNANQALSRRDDQGNFYSRFEIPALSISEQFAPLIGVNMKLKNDMNFTFDYKKSRNLNMSFNIDYQLAETKTTEYVFGFGYTMKNVIIGFLLPKSQKGPKRKRKKKGKKSPKNVTPPKGKNGKDLKGNDLNFTFDFSYRDDVTVNHRLDQGISDKTRGSKTLTISPAIDYDISKRLNVRLFYDHRRVIPAISTSFPITTNQGGVTIRFSLN
ncbi:MAG: cell surface protein SprA [Saprospiraceae bacterium]